MSKPPFPMRRRTIQCVEGVDCSAQHTIYQPQKWVCLCCGSPVETDRPAHKAEIRCAKLHTNETVMCTGCGKKWQGWEFASEWEDICS